MPATTGGLANIRENLFYVGCGKQSVWGTAVAPTWYSLWLDGTDVNPQAKITLEREGDTSPFMGLAYKENQYGVAKVVEYARPITLGYILQALLGSGSDTYTAPTKSSTFASAVLAGATSFQSVGSLGNSGTLGINATPAYSNAGVYEVVTVNLASQSGTGPYTYTLNGGGAFLNAHAMSDAITSASQHTLTRQTAGYDAFTLEFAFGSATLGEVWRLQDAVCYEVKLTCNKGKPIKVEHSWYGALHKLQSAFSTPSYEGSRVVGQAGAPFIFWEGSGNWLVDGSSSANAATVEKLELDLKNTTNAEDFISESISPALFIPSDMDITATAEAIFTSYNQFNETYFGAKTLSTGASDSYLVGYGAIQTTLQADPVNSLLVNVLNGAYTADSKLTPKLDAKGLRQPFKLTGQRTAAIANPFSATLMNSLASSY